MPTCTFAVHRAAIVDIVVHGAECVLSFDSGRVACLESAHCAERGRRGTVVTGDIGGTVTLPRQATFRSCCDELQVRKDCLSPDAGVIALVG
jgi:hypothetical protein